jgi:hypothetical protein
LCLFGALITLIVDVRDALTKPQDLPLTLSVSGQQFGPKLEAFYEGLTALATD